MVVIRPVSWRAATLIRMNEAIEAAIHPAARRAGRPPARDVAGGLKGPSIQSGATAIAERNGDRPAQPRSPKETRMQDEPTSYRVPDPGVRALFTESSRYQAWLDVEAALARAQAELGIIPASAAEEIARKAQLSLLDRDAIRAGLARTGHSLVPLVW